MYILHAFLALVHTLHMQRFVLLTALTVEAEPS
jgi:hypothetical protein